MNYFMYLGLLFFIYIFYFIFEERIMKIIGIKKYFVYNDKKTTLLTAKAWSLRFLFVSFLSLSLSFPVLFGDMRWIMDTSLFEIFFISSFPMSFITFYFGMNILLRPSVFGEKSRTNIPSFEYIYYNTSDRINMPLSYTEIFTTNQYKHILYCDSLLCFLEIGYFYFINSLHKILAVLLVFSIVLIFYMYMNKFNEKWYYDIRYPPGIYIYSRITLILCFPMLFSFIMILW